MRKMDLVGVIAERAGMDRAAVTVVVEDLMKEIKRRVAGGESVFLRGFGAFVPVERREKKARNISKGVTITVPAHQEPVFRPYPGFKKLMKK